MSGQRLSKKLLWLELAGGLLIILCLWADEAFDLPHVLFGAPATPANYQESLFETVIILVVGSLVLGISYWLVHRLQKTLLEMDRLFGVISHDLRSPFTNLLGNTEILKEQVDELDPADRQALVDGLHSAALKSYSLLDNLLYWARLQRDNTRPEPTVIAMRTLVAEVIEELAAATGEKPVTVRSRVDVEHFVYAVETETRAILRNLLGNAVKFSFPGREVEIAVQPKGQLLRVSVSDRGPGLTAQRRRQLLRREFNPSTPGTAGEKGSGLGLMIVKEFVRRNGGKFTIRSTPGQGSTFAFTLPRAAPVENR